MSKKIRIVIVGAGTGGISVAARILNEKNNMLEVTLVDPAQKHFYQPLWTLVGAGVKEHEESERSMESVIPEGAKWIQKKVAKFMPNSNEIILEGDESLAYDYLIVAAGMELNWEKIKGAKEALNAKNVCSNYLPYGSTKTWQVMQNSKEGNVIFTQPPLPIKCAGAPQKALYLADDYFREANTREKINLIFANNGPRIFGVDKYRVELEKIITRKNITTKYEHNLVEVKSEESIAVFERPDKSLVEVKYSMLHIVPPMSAPKFIKESELVDQAGWVNVDKFTLIHNKFKNVFSLGDCSSLPTSRTGAAIRKQAPVLVSNLLAAINNQEMTAKYDGYSSCPLVTGYGKVILAEFDYDGKPMETFPFDQSKESRAMWILKVHLLPKFYWYGMLKGRL